MLASKQSSEREGKVQLGYMMKEMKKTSEFNKKQIDNKKDTLFIYMSTRNLTPFNSGYSEFKVIE